MYRHMTTQNINFDPTGQPTVLICPDHNLDKATLAQLKQVLEQSGLNVVVGGDEFVLTPRNAPSMEDFKIAQAQVVLEEPLNKPWYRQFASRKRF